MNDFTLFTFKLYTFYTWLIDNKAFNRKAFRKEAQRILDIYLKPITKINIAGTIFFSNFVQNRI